jgi:hypothetical protein
MGDATEVNEMAQAATAKTTRITVETENLMVIRRAKADLAWCPECRAEVDVITLDNDSLAEPVTASQIQKRLATNKLHFWRPANGLRQIFLPSLFRCFELDGVQRLFQSDEKPFDQSRRKQQ